MLLLNREARTEDPICRAGLESELRRILTETVSVGRLVSVLDVCSESEFTGSAATGRRRLCVGPVSLERLLGILDFSPPLTRRVCSGKNFLALLARQGLGEIPRYGCLQGLIATLEVT